METSRALKLVPLPELSIYSQELSDFHAWNHGIWFHLSYYNLDGFLRENESDDERRVVVRKRKYNGAVPDAPVISDEDRRRRLLAYSIIWSSAKDLIPSMELSLNKRLCDDVQFDPMKLWQLILEYFKFRFPWEDMEFSSTT